MTKCVLEKDQTSNQFIYVKDKPTSKNGFGTVFFALVGVAIFIACLRWCLITFFHRRSSIPTQVGNATFVGVNTVQR